MYVCMYVCVCMCVSYKTPFVEKKRDRYEEKENIVDPMMHFTYLDVAFIMGMKRAGGTR